jgi:uncharacterized protein DUF4235
MANFGARVTMKIMTMAIGIPIGIVTRKAVERIWVAAGPDRPRTASDDGVQWTDAIAWAALTGVGMAAADLATRKGASEAWRTLIGTEPPTSIKPKASRRVSAAEPAFPAVAQPPD